MRRQSSGSSKIPQQQQEQQQQQNTTENLFEIDDMKLSPPPPPDSQTSDVHRMHIDIDAAASPSTTGLKPAKDNNNNKDRSSLSGRPLRKAAEKVHSYKEIPLNTKMRRKDH